VFADDFECAILERPVFFVRTLDPDAPLARSVYLQTFSSTDVFDYRVVDAGHDLSPLVAGEMPAYKINDWPLQENGGYNLDYT
jgi:hypothetical protein